MKNENYYIKLAVEKTKDSISKNIGGPFGSVIVKNGEIISIGTNRVLADNDPTQHAEIVAIREACSKLNTFDLSGCEIYATCEPCPMCLSAIIWSNIKTVYYGCSSEDAGNIGFRDDFIYDYIKNKNEGVLNIKRLEDFSECTKLFEEYSKNKKTIY